MKLKPMHDRIIVRRREESNTTPGGLYIPSNSKEKPSEGEVLAVGPGRFLPNGEVKPLDVKTGDRILFSKYSGSEVKIEGEDYLIIREDDVLAVF
jgi:chaperonin GroES